MKRLIQTLLQVSLFITLSATVAFAQPCHQGQRGQQERPTFTHESLNNGIRITITSDDAQVVERIQRRADSENGAFIGRQQAPEWIDEVQVSHETIDNGVIVEITTENSELVDDIQDHAEQRSERQEQRSERQERRAERREFMQNVERSRENIEDGIRISLTTTDSDALDWLHDPDTRTPAAPFMREHRREDWTDDVTMDVAETSDGLVVTLTSNDSEVVERLQNAPGRRNGRNGRHNRNNRRQNQRR